MRKNSHSAGSAFRAGVVAAPEVVVAAQASSRRAGVAVVVGQEAAAEAVEGATLPVGVAGEALRSP